MKLRIILWSVTVLLCVTVIIGVIISHFTAPPQLESTQLRQAREQAEQNKLQRDEHQAEFLSGWFIVTVSATTAIALLSIAAVSVQICILHPRHRRRMEQARLLEEGTRLYPDQFGNYPKKVTAYGLLESEPGNIVQPVPTHLTYSPHIQMRDAPSALLPEKQQLEPARQLPQRLELVELLKTVRPNSQRFELVLGQSSSGPILRPFGADSLHFGLLGATGSGKTTQEHSILFQLALADPTAQRILFAFLDLEGKTSQPFKKAPHTSWIADDQHLASVALVELEREMNRRARLPIYAVVLEEFLSLRDELPGKDWQRIVNLAIRGRKARIFLICASQAFYSDEETRILRGQLRTRHTFAVEDAGTAIAFGITDRSAYSALTADPQPGRFLLKSPSGLILAQAPYIDPSQIAAYFERTTPVAEPSGGKDATSHSDSVQNTIASPESRQTDTTDTEAVQQHGTTHLEETDNETDILQKVAIYYKQGATSARTMAAALNCGKDKALKLMDRARELGLL